MGAEETADRSRLGIRRAEACRELVAELAALESDIAQAEERFMHREGELEVLVGDYYGLDPHQR